MKKLAFPILISRTPWFVAGAFALGMAGCAAEAQDNGDLLFPVSASEKSTALSLNPRPEMKKPTQPPLPRDIHSQQIILKFAEGSHVRLRAGMLMLAQDESDPAQAAREIALLDRAKLSVSQAQQQLGTVSELLQKSAARRIRPLFRRAEALLDAERQAGEAQSGEELADLNLYFAVDMKGIDASPIAISALLGRLNALSIVEVAYSAPVPHNAAADLPPTTDNYTDLQSYLEVAPTGIDARYAWTLPGGKGKGISIIDVEYAWVLDHEDLPSPFFQAGEMAYSYFGDHGTAVLGVMVAAENSYGMTGIVSDARHGVSSVSYYDPVDFELKISVAHAISEAAAALTLGDIILVEQHAPGPSSGKVCLCNCSQFEYIAMEYFPAEYDAIKSATARGITVVEAAGNGSMDLSSPIYGGAFIRSRRDSGAILVGAGTAANHKPTCWTNSGARIDVQGFGDTVATLGYGDLAEVGGSSDTRQWYTATFAGTSSASPIVVGAVAAVQGQRKARGGAPLAPKSIRSLLHDTGTPQGSGRPIGPLPNLRAAM